MLFLCVILEDIQERRCNPYFLTLTLSISSIYFTTVLVKPHVATIDMMGYLTSAPCTTDYDDGFARFKIFDS